MAAGDVTVQVVDAIAATVDTAVTALRVSANDHWGYVPLSGGKQVMIIHIEEA